jgi:hypothetical protein
LLFESAVWNDHILLPHRKATNNRRLHKDCAASPTSRNDPPKYTISL